VDLICGRVVVGDTVTTVDLTDSAGAYIVLRIDTLKGEVDVPEVGKHYDLVPRQSRLDLTLSDMGGG
jgi:hypothetical protein